MKRLTLALLILGLASLACSLYSEPTTGTAAELFPTKPIPHPTIPDTITATATAAPVFCTVSAEGLHLRDAPSIEGTVTGWLFAGDVAIIESTRGAWYQVRTARGAGFVHSKYCEVTE